MAIYRKESVVAASLELCECTKLYTLLVIVYRRQALSPLACARGLRFIQERRGAARSLWSPRRAVWSPRTAVWSPRRALWSPGRALWSLRAALRSPRTARKYGMSGHLISPTRPLASSLCFVVILVPTVATKGTLVWRSAVAIADLFFGVAGFGCSEAPQKRAPRSVFCT